MGHGRHFILLHSIIRNNKNENIRSKLQRIASLLTVIIIWMNWIIVNNEDISNLIGKI